MMGLPDRRGQRSASGATGTTTGNHGLHEKGRGFIGQGKLLLVNEQFVAAIDLCC